MKLILTLSTVSLMGLISLLHVYWACGGRWGSEEALPSKAGKSEPIFVPTKIGTLTVAILILIAAFILLVQSGYIQSISSNIYIRVGCITCACVFFLRAIGDFRYIGFFKKINHSKFARNDSWMYSPLCLYFGLTYTILLF
ncbi:DUF3995 domain-containing protein [Lysinibacillus sp. NPDC096418]|uniref:DUF3995 domain-containing protein n=1 Tax=Lysinibacillus sp. NPDC096418 TaxID=3364138 RepID=UPI00382E9EF2